jgi:hypothetical protein
LDWTELAHGTSESQALVNKEINFQAAREAKSFLTVFAKFSRESVFYGAIRLVD